MTRTTEDEDDDDDETAEREAWQVIALFCETAIRVEQEILALGKGRGTQNIPATPTSPAPHTTCSPIYLAFATDCVLGLTTPHSMLSFELEHLAAAFDSHNTLILLKLKIISVD